MFTGLTFLIFAAAALAIVLLWLRMESFTEQLAEFMRRVEWLERQNIERSQPPRRPGSAFARRRSPQPSPSPTTPPQRPTSTVVVSPDRPSTPGPWQPVQPLSTRPANISSAMPTTGASAPPPYRPAPPAPPAGSPPAGSPPDGPGPDASPSFEQELGTKWAVYLGGAAIALGGLFLVRHAIEAGWIGPGIRILMGLLLGGGLVTAGTRMRLGETNIRVANIDGAHVPSVLTAAGTVILFGTIYAAHALYDFIGPGLTFVLLGAVGMATMLSAALHGPALAGLGLAGSYVAPLLIQTHSPNRWALVIYLTVITAAALGLARIRGWLWLAYTAVGGGALWALAMCADRSELAGLPLMVHLLIQTGIAAAVIAIEPNLDLDDSKAEPDGPTTVAFAALTFIGVVALLIVPYNHAMYLVFASALLAIFAGSALMAPAAAALGAFAVLLLATLLLDWPAVAEVASGRHLFGAAPNIIRLPESLAAFLTYGTLAAAGLTATATWTLAQRPRLPALTTSLFAVAAALPPLVMLTIAYLRVTQFGTAIMFSVAGAALAVCFAVLAEIFLAREVEGDDDADNDAATWHEATRIPTGAFAAAATAALAIALVAGLQRGYLTVAFALAALGAAYVSSRRDIPMLRYAVLGLGAAVLGRILWDPRIMGADVGATPVFNWLLVGYGIPALAFWQASRVLRQRQTDTTSDLCDALALLFATLLGTFQIRHYVHDGDPLALSTGHLEMGLLAIQFLVMSHAVTLLARHRQTAVLELAHSAFAMLAALIVGLGLLISQNPAFTNEAIGGHGLASTLLPAYLLPGLVALYIARHAQPFHTELYIRAVAVGALVLLFAYVTLEVRHAFHGEHIGLFKNVRPAETWAYTAAWLALAIGYLAYGLIRGSVPARAASGVLLALTILKVGLIDLAGVTGIWRALSFLCLGGVLIGIGLVYQRLVFGGPDSSRSAPSARPKPPPYSGE
ncbi:MAG: DUF2339 domain-containing protein [Hyphomicrobiaceae bacterium]|nr:DUF2339 domain-containing protein [Hyphomicrobiaceae bacterium]